MDHYDPSESAPSRVRKNRKVRENPTTLSFFFFRSLHGIEDAEHTMRPVDMSCAYWIKAKEVSLRRDLYEQVVSDDSRSVEQTAKLLRPANSPVWDEAYHKQRHVWEAHLDNHEREASSSRVSSTAWTRLS